MAAEPLRTENVELLVKNPCDRPGTPPFALSASLSQSIGDIKNELATTYPGQPAVKHQRLIFSGKLLTNDSKLATVLAGYDVNEPQTFHIVVADAERRVARAPGTPLSTQAPSGPPSRRDAPIGSHGEGIGASRPSASGAAVPNSDSIGSGTPGTEIPPGPRAPGYRALPGYAGLAGDLPPVHYGAAESTASRSTGTVSTGAPPSVVHPAAGIGGTVGAPPHGMPMMYGHPAALMYGYGNSAAPPPPYFYPGMHMPPPPEDLAPRPESFGLAPSDVVPDGISSEEYQRHMASVASLNGNYEQEMATLHHYRHSHAHDPHAHPHYPTVHPHSLAHHHHHHHHHQQHHQQHLHHRHQQHFGHQHEQHFAQHHAPHHTHFQAQHHAQHFEDHDHVQQNANEHLEADVPHPPGHAPHGGPQGPRRRAFGIAVEFGNGRGGNAVDPHQPQQNAGVGGQGVRGHAGVGGGANVAGQGVNVAGQMGFVHNNGNVNGPRVRHYVFQIELNAINWSLIFKLIVAVLLLKQEGSAQRVYGLIFAAVIIYLWQTDRLGAVRRVIQLVLPSPPQLFEAVASSTGQHGERGPVNRLAIALSYIYSFMYGFVCSLLPSWEPVVLPDIDELFNRLNQPAEADVTDADQAGSTREGEASGASGASDREPARATPADGNENHPHAD